MAKAGRAEEAHSQGPLMKRWLPVLLFLLAFVAPGAWMITRLPPVSIAKALTLATVGAWFVAAALGVLGSGRIHRRLMWSLGLVGASIGVSYVLAGALPEVALYDLYGDMSLLQWLAFPAVFVLAASSGLTATSVRRGLSAVVFTAAPLALVMSLEWATTGNSTVFGSTAYAVPALACTIPLSFGLATGARGVTRSALYSAGVVIIVALGAFSGSTMGTLAAVFGALLSAAVVLPRMSDGALGRWGSRAALGVAALMVAGLLVAQVPAVSGRWINAESLSGFDRNVITRLYLWEGAQQMVGERPVFGFGPSGYRLRAAEYTPVAIHKYGPGAQGDIGPTAYSPQSPHSAVWEIATRLGIVGLLAFFALLAAWSVSVRERLQAADDQAALRTALAASLASTLFALMVNPAIFAIGLLAPVVAGTALSPLGSRADETPRAPWVRRSLLGIGVAVLVLAVWLGVGEYRAASIATDDAAAALAGHESVLTVLLGYPPSVRGALEVRLLTAADDAQAAEAHRAVDEAPMHISAFAPNLVSLAAYSLAQADRTGRRDVSWEKAVLERAGAVLPDIPSLAGERLHLALVEDDRAAIAAASVDAERWGRAYALTDGYLRRAAEVLSTTE